ncbi:hypothetical protein [uncultured Roseibium sp.]|uniref:hypothetical protein n=1 Tax=uncultured Roseibium sp. TaxID=1936171 RepID=UPI00260D0DCB|nr:hypothetical protein [uncultured Roseibium sp.]
MKSSRRGFLGLIAGGATAGPGALKGALASASEMGFPTASVGIPQGGDNNPNTAAIYIARDILRNLERKKGEPEISRHNNLFADIEALKSISPSAKARMQHDKHLDRELAFMIDSFLRERGLKWVGLSEESLMSIIKKAAGD